MAAPIIFFRKSKADFSDSRVSATASQGATFAPLALNRSNQSGWGTAGSVDADNTTFTVDMTDTKTVDNILILKHNFKSFKVEYWTGTIWTDFSPAILETTNTLANNRYEFTQVITSKIRLTVYGTQIANKDKRMAQFLPLELLGQLDGWPVIKAPTLSRNLQKSNMISGKQSIRPNVGGISAALTVKNWNNDADLSIIEDLYALNQGFLFWPCGGDENQFSTKRIFYRMEDIFLCRCSNDHKPEFYQGLYQSGMPITMNINEVVD